MGKHAAAVLSMMALVALAGVAGATAEPRGAEVDANGLSRRALASAAAWHLREDWKNFSEEDLFQVEKEVPSVYYGWANQRGYAATSAEIDRIVEKEKSFLDEKSDGTEPQPISHEAYDQAMADINHARGLLTSMADEIKPLERVVPLIQDQLKKGTPIVKLEFYSWGGEISFGEKDLSYLVLHYWSNRFYGSRYSHQWTRH